MVLFFDDFCVGGSGVVHHLSLVGCTVYSHRLQQLVNCVEAVLLMGIAGSYLGAYVANMGFVSLCRRGL